MKNYSTPRTLADCVFTSGYPEVVMYRNRSADFILAISIGIVIGVALISWWAGV